MVSRCRLFNSTFVLIVFLLFASRPLAAQLVYEDLPVSQGTLKSSKAGVLVITDDQGVTREYKIQEKVDGGISLAGAQAIIDFPAQVKVVGKFSKDELKPGTLIRFQVQLNRLGKLKGPVASVQILDDPATKLTIELGAEVEEKFFQCEVTAELSKIRNNRYIISLPRNTFTRKTILSLELTDDVEINYSSDDYRRAAPGSKVTKLAAVKFNTGDFVVQSIEIEIASTANSSTGDIEDKLLAKYKKFSDEAKKPRDVRSQHFLLHTDISDRQAKILLDKLETMTSLVSSYYGKQPGALIECFVVKDLGQWTLDNRFTEHAVAKIKERAGVTFSRSLGNQRQSIVYSCDNHGVVQHEAIHAYCFLTFGSTGPTWYAEGMAELGCYWKNVGQLDVDIDPVVIDYLKNAEPKSMLEIVAPGQVTNDSWKAYSWRWALCHMLACNPNYSGRFKSLGLGMMTGQANVSFETVYGDLAKEISFEYDLFVAEVDNGYRPDLAAWQWNRRFVKISGSKRAQSKVLADHGWQSTGVKLEVGSSYDLAAQGTWKLQKNGDDINADGDSNGQGRLMGVIMKDYQLSEPFPLGVLTSYKPTTDGDLYVRCLDAWNDLANNEGEVTLHIRKTPSQ
ncbi:MAG: hypothetical protein COA78_02275 [Blastopirellula sp.]|nr:MAG: hypothetical protein COA78_02275 [Blastopirellula sp.]